METYAPQTLLEAIRHFSDPDTCHNYMVSIRWPDGKMTCPACGGENIGVIASRRMFQCKAKECRKQFSVKVGTIMEDSPIGLDKWLAAIWLIANAKNGVSSWEIHRALGITQKSAWFLLHRVRLAMQQGTFHKLSGEVEVDETYIGGKARNMHKSKRAEKITGRGAVGKAIVVGVLERTTEKSPSKVRTKVIPNTRKHTVQAQVRDHVELGAAVYSDALASYDSLSPDYVHEAVDHAVEYVRGNVHTNGLENYWSLLKRCIKGTYVSVMPFHLFRYLDEETFRFNEREENDGARFKKVTGTIAGKRVTYAMLTGKVTLPETNESPTM
jgi:transposase-like protein